MAREPHRAVRGVDETLWKETVQAAHNMGEDHGQFVSRALRRELDAMRAPIDGEIQPARAKAPVFSITEVDTALRVAQILADRRGGRYRGRIPDRHLTILRLAYDQALGLGPVRSAVAGTALTAP